jgi:hypothetical protein
MEQAKTKKSREIEIEDEDFTVIIKFFGIRTSKPDEFVDKLEELCREYAIQDDFSFKYSVEG